MHIKSKTHKSIAMFSLKLYTLTGFKHGSAVSEAAAIIFPKFEFAEIRAHVVFFFALQ
jgi:hypothetical protein